MTEIIASRGPSRFLGGAGPAAAVSPDIPGAVGIPGAVSAPPPRWVTTYIRHLAALDVALVALAVLASYTFRFTLLPGILDSAATYAFMCACFGAVWVAALAVCGAYEVRRISTGAEEFRRVIVGTLTAAGIVAVICYAGKINVARGFVVIAIPVGLVLLVVGRMVSRQLVRKRRARGEWSFRILVAGTTDSVQHFVDMAAARPDAGMRVVGACVEDAPVGTELAPGVPVLAGVTGVVAAAAEIDAEVVALSGAGLGPATIRQLGWSLEGTGRDLVVVPGLTEVAGPRVHVTPVEGLPLMWVDKPIFRGYKRILKRGFDTATALTLLVFISPLLLVVGALIKLDSRGPVFFTQTRYGKQNAPFRIWKFRSMSTDAAARHLSVVTEAGATEGQLFFKVKADPRVTRVGRCIRKLSVDELPQLFNVLNGTMSLVGPRPQCDYEVATYDNATRRRLMVKPGMTGLWQVSGRSNLTPADGVRLDLYYVENWSLSLDLAIMARTVNAVLRGSGAF